MLRWAEKSAAPRIESGKRSSRRARLMTSATVAPACSSTASATRSCLPSIMVSRGCGVAWWWRSMTVPAPSAFSRVAPSSESFRPAESISRAAGWVSSRPARAARSWPTVACGSSWRSRVCRAYLARTLRMACSTSWPDGRRAEGEWGCRAKDGSAGSSAEWLSSSSLSSRAAQLFFTGRVLFLH
eukprot:scaffold6554_cov28-Tisochrysis_lutea.AAC.3